MSSWNTWLADLVEVRAVSGFLYIGSDQPEVLAGFDLDRIDQVLVVNGNPTQKDAWKELAASTERLHFSPRVIGEGEEPVSFHALSLPSLSAIVRPKEVLEIFPGLREVSNHEIATTQIRSLLSGLPITAGKQRVLRAELNGAEVIILRQLSNLPDDEAPEHVFLRLPAERLYESADPSIDLDAVLEQTGYRVERLSDEDPDFLEFWLRMDVTQAALRRKDKALEEARVKIEAQDKALCEAQAAEAEQRKILQEARAQLEARDAELQKAEQALNDKMAEAKREIDAALRLQSMARADVQDMRKRYSDLCTEHDAQAHLIEDIIHELDAFLQAAPKGTNRKTTAQKKSTKASSVRAVGGASAIKTPKAKSDV